MKKVTLLVVTFFSITACISQKKDFVITDYGAISDGVTDNVKAIQHAIDEANINGGGRVVVPRGRFLTGVIHLKSNVELFVHEEAVLLASTNRAITGQAKELPHGSLQIMQKIFPSPAKELLTGNVIC